MVANSPAQGGIVRRNFSAHHGRRRIWYNFW